MGQAWSANKHRLQNDPSKKIFDEDVQPFDEHSSRESTCRQMSWSQKYTSGWRAGALLCCTAATLVLLTNIIVLV